jgi:hypothetical protein
MLLKDSTALELLSQHNRRFGAGPAIDEMIELQREFEIFAPRRSLRNSYDLIGIRPTDHGERRRWYIALEQRLRSYDSERPNLNGYDRLILAYVENFNDAKPLPIFMQCHAAKDDPRLLVSKGRPVIFIPEDYLIISVPTTAADAAKGAKAP